MQQMISMFLSLYTVDSSELIRLKMEKIESIVITIKPFKHRMSDCINEWMVNPIEIDICWVAIISYLD